MARQDVAFAIDNGPSKLGLMLSLFDTELGARTVKFRVYGQLEPTDPLGSYDIQIQIFSVSRLHSSATIWDIEGMVETSRGKKLVSIYYMSDTRVGHMRLEERLRAKGDVETPIDSQKAGALFEIIFRMINRYRESHPGNLDEEIFMLFEKAKRVHYAVDRDSRTKEIESS